MFCLGVLLRGKGQQVTFPERHSWSILNFCIKSAYKSLSLLSSAGVYIMLQHLQTSRQ